MKTISLSTRNWSIPTSWPMKSVARGPREASEIISCLIDRIETVFGGRDIVTDTIVIVAEDTLKKLTTKPETLWRRLDWVLKWKILTDFRQKYDAGFDWLRSQDLEFHDLDPERGHYLTLRREGAVERVITDELIEQAARKPPEDTRAFVRGQTVRWLRAEGRNREIAAHQPWDQLKVIDANGNRPISERQQTVCLANPYWEETIGNPFDPYPELASKIQKRIISGF